MAIEYYRSTATAMFLGAIPGVADGIPILDEFTDFNDLFLEGSPTPVRGGHDPSQYVPDMMAAPLGMKTIPESECDARYDEQEATQSSLEHLYLRDWQGECLDQNGQGYCWYYSTTSAVMLKRVAAHLPFARLNPHPGASMEKGGRDEGGWCGLSLARIRKEGLCEEGTGPGQIPAHSFGRKTNELYMTDAVRAVREKYIVTDDWYDLGKPAYSQALKDAQKWTCLFNNNPVPTDRNIWGHSTADIRRVRIERGSWGYLTLNSWLRWGRRGLAVMRGNYYKADGAVSVVNTRAA